MRGTTAVLLLLIFTQNGADADTCPLKMCTDLVKDLGASEAKQQVTEKQLDALEAQMKEIQDNPKVAFSASMGPRGFTGPFNKDSTLVYKNVFINVGDAYNKATGIFTAPVRGAYYFSFFYHCGVKHSTVLLLYRNEEQVAIAKHHQSVGPPENGGNGLTLLLEKGDQIYIVLQKKSWIWDGDSVTVFSGFLIYALK